jgi:hypothetical protein
MPDTCETEPAVIIEFPMGQEEYDRLETLRLACNAHVGEAFVSRYEYKTELLTDMLDDVFDIWWERYVLLKGE